jgi:hypothetical protein
MVARVQNSDQWDPMCVIVYGNRIFFEAMPCYVSNKKFFKNILVLFVAENKVTKKCDDFILRTGKITNIM